MICPRCDKPLNKNKRDFGLVFECSECSGKSISLPVLKKFIDEKYINEIWQKKQIQNLADALFCPSCNENMHCNIINEDENQTVIDICSKCLLIWFDKDELRVLPKKKEEVAKNEQISEKAQKALNSFIIEKELNIVRQKRKINESFGRVPPSSIFHYLLPLKEYNYHKLVNFPIITYLLSALLLFIYFVNQNELNEVIAEFGFISNDAFKNGGITILSSFFLHANFSHLLGNLYFLLVFGDNVEDIMSKLRYSIIIITSSISGILLHLFINFDASRPVVGASAGISGIICYYALRFPNVKIGDGFFFVKLYWFRLPAIVYVGFWFAFQLFGLIMSKIGLISNISFSGHIGGALCGILFWYFTKKWDINLPKHEKRNYKYE